MDRRSTSKLAHSISAAASHEASKEQDVELAAVRAANRAYYTALSARDLIAMEKVWSQSSEVVNIAPPIQPVAHVGWDAVKRNYESFWAKLADLAVSMDEPVIRIEGNIAWAFGVEHSKRILKNGQTSSGPNLGTSVFVKRDERWFVVFHQAALIPKD